ncbi:MAG: hypothetical protein KAV87_68510 [Desulfobacteraceae bacterium]|nr:hypothetical protein [Desulfobacteraceae bacterium]
MPERLRSRKLWVAMLTAGGMLIAAGMQVDLDFETLAGVLTPVVAYLMGQSYVDGKK